MAVKDYTVTPSVIERFNKKYAVNPDTACWLWTGGLLRGGYGSFQFAPRPNRLGCSAHRASWLIHRGHIPLGMKVCHQCDTPSCVNPAHLFLGTQADNMRDCANKGRTSKTPKNTVLTADDVRQIRRAYTGQYGELRRLAKQYKVNAMSIFRIVHGQSWCAIAAK